MAGWIRDNRDAAARGAGFHFILRRRGESGGPYVGTVGLSNVVYGVFRAAHLGYSLDRTCVGLGYIHVRRVVRLRVAAAAAQTDHSLRPVEHTVLDASIAAEFAAGYRCVSCVSVRTHMKNSVLFQGLRSATGVSICAPPTSRHLCKHPDPFLGSRRAALADAFSNQVVCRTRAVILFRLPLVHREPPPHLHYGRLDRGCRRYDRRSGRCRRSIATIVARAGAMSKSPR